MSGELPVPDYENESSPSSSSPDHLQEPVSEQIHRNILGAEFLVGLFWSAANSFRHDSIVRPFPPMFVEGGAGTSSGPGDLGREGEGQKDIEGVRQVLASLPPLEKIACGKATLSTQQSELLRWIINPKRFTVSPKEPSSFESLLQQADSTPNSTANRKPKFIFELEYNEESESKYRSIMGDHGVMYAFHGSSVENFYSIVHNGLLNLFNKVSAFGQGTYLSTELGVCLNWSPSGSLWPGGVLPHAASCVAMCEVVKHPSVMSRCQVGGEPNIQQKVPEKYFIVTNDEFIRVKYILIYELQKPVVRNRGWLHQHKFVVVLALYLIFLFCVGASQSKISKKFLRKFYNYFQ